jgi:hypothetical protein
MIGTEINVMAAEKTSYLIVEVFDHLNGNCSNVYEIEIYDKNGDKIAYTTSKTEVYGSVRNGIPNYWNDTIGQRTRLNDGDYNNQRTTLNHASNPGDKSWTRFVINYDNSNGLSDVKTWVGNNSIPKEITLYKTKSYDFATNIQQRNNDGLTLIGNINPKSTSSVVPYTITDNTPSSDDQELDIEASKYTVNSGISFTTNVIVRNAPNLYAEDITVQYDATKFEYISAIPADDTALKIYHEDKDTEGKVKFIVASTGASHPLDGEGKEYTPTCLGKKFMIVFGDVNNNGEFTLGDLAIASKLLSTTSDSWGDYHPDVDLNGDVEEVDLNQIVTAILSK